MRAAWRAGGQADAAQGGRQAQGLGVGGAVGSGAAARRCRRRVSMLHPSALQSPAPGSASPFLIALEVRAAAAGGPGPSAASIASRGGSPAPADGRSQATALRQQRVSTAARLQALIARANRIASATTTSSGRGSAASSCSGATGGGGRRPASALQQRRAPVLTEAQRAASAMAMRQQLRSAAQHGAVAAAGGRPAPQAGSRLGRPPGNHAQPAATASLRTGSRAAASVDPPAAPTPRAAAAAADRRAPLPRPSSAAAGQAPTRQLPALPASRPPSRMQQYGGSQPHSSSRAVTPERGPSGQAFQGQLSAQALPPTRPCSAAPRVPLLHSTSLGSSGSAAQRAEADASELFAVMLEAHRHCLQQQQQPAAAAEPQERLRHQLEQACSAAELQAAACDIAAWLAPQLHPRAAELLHQLVAALRASSSSSSSGGGEGGQRPLAGHASGASSALAPAMPSGSLRLHQLFQQCGQLRGEKAALERLNAELSSQVRQADPAASSLAVAPALQCMQQLEGPCWRGWAPAAQAAARRPPSAAFGLCRHAPLHLAPIVLQVAAYQEQLAGLHLRVDNLLRERQRLQEEAAEQVRGRAPRGLRRVRGGVGVG